MQEISLSTKQKHKTDEEHEEIFKKFIELLSNIFFLLQSMIKRKKKDFTSYSCRVVMETNFHKTILTLALCVMHSDIFLNSVISFFKILVTTKWSIVFKTFRGWIQVT